MMYLKIVTKGKSLKGKKGGMFSGKTSTILSFRRISSLVQVNEFSNYIKLFG